MITFVGSASVRAVRESAFAFEKETEIHGELHLRSSGPMLSQLTLYRRGDLYFPGSPVYRVKVIERKAVDSNSVREIAYLIPSINGPRSSPKSIKG